MENKSDEEIKKYAELYISCCTDYLLGKITKEHYIDMMKLFTENLTK